MGCGASTQQPDHMVKISPKKIPSGISAKQRAFIETKWLPFANELKHELRKVEAKTKAGVAPAERLPPQEQFMDWGRRCIELTEEIRGRGRGSLSLMYQALQRMGQHDGVAPYTFDMVPTEWSSDGYVRVLDAVTRASFYGTPSASSGSKKSDTNTKGRAVNEDGDLKQSVQESAIANTEITGIMTQRDARLLVIGGIMRWQALKLVRIRQNRALNTIAHTTKSRTKRELIHRLVRASVDEDKCAEDADAEACILLLDDLKEAFSALHDENMDNVEASHKLHRKVTHGISEKDKRRDDYNRIAQALSAVQFTPDTPSWEALHKHGMVASSFGQLTSDTKVKLAKQVEHIVDSTWAQDELTPEVMEFIDFARNNPGGVFKDDMALHRRMLCAVQMSSGVSVVSKSRITHATAHRFLSVRWVRTVPLMRGEAEGDPTMVREASTVEETRIRTNAFSYDNQHGLGLCGSTHRSRNELDLRAVRPVKLMPRELHDELGELVVNDPGAKIGNWFCNDLDKVLNEFVLLNAQPVDHGDVFTATLCPLPGEAPVIVGQNPRVASSIGKTQHTQMATGDANWWPILRLRSPDYDPQHIPLELQLGPDAFVELVQIGDDPDSVSLRVETLEIGAAVDPAVIKLVHGARMALLSQFGGRAVDFNFYACANEERSGAILLLTPMAMIQANSDKTLWFNNDTGLSDKSYNLPCHSIDFSQGKGNIHVFGEEAWKQGLEGRAMMGRLYDFVRKAGSRKVLEKYLREAVRGWEEPHVGLAKELSSSSSVPPIESNSFWDSP